MARTTRDSDGNAAWQADRLDRLTAHTDLASQLLRWASNTRNYDNHAALQTLARYVLGLADSGGSRPYTMEEFGELCDDALERGVIQSGQYDWIVRWLSEWV